MNCDLPAPAPAYFVMFTGVKRREHMIDWISPLAFQHCFAFFYDPSAERWMLYEVNRGGAGILALKGDEFDRWLTFMRWQGGRVLRIDTPPPRNRPPFQLGMWCVVAVRHMVGIRSRAIRPIGLWRDLLKAGASEVFVS
ncbi:MAG: hypothetical protein E6R03_12155 [Hyphomicrobiaceae bacterium]|nr:MAG: hypothetical protein E6R03_12155 [Hyphomicrobiaceae bacterium]